MPNKKFLAFTSCLLILACSCTANAEGLKIGILTKSGTEEFSSESFSDGLWSVFTGTHSKADKVMVYDDINSMLLALNKGEIDEIDLPQIVGEYVIAKNPDYEISCVMRTEPIGFVFGFLKERNYLLWHDFNRILNLMQQDGTLDGFNARYLANPGKDEPESVKFDLFPDAPTIKIAVTGDMPPIDYVAQDGKAAGFNAVILAEIGRRMEINIELIDINAGARNTTLISGRADGVFWYITDTFDKPEGILFSQPYYTFDEFVHISKKK